MDDKPRDESKHKRDEDGKFAKEGHSRVESTLHAYKKDGDNKHAEGDEDEESYLPEDTDDENINEFNRLLNEHDRKYWEDRKQGKPIVKTI